MKTPNSSVFDLELLHTSNGIESILRGGRKLFPLLPNAFKGIKQIAFIGWGSQGPAQAQNLRDSLKTIGSDIVVKVGLQKNSKSAASARKAGFTEEDGTLGLMDEVIPDADLVILLISDGAQTKLWEQITDLMKNGSTLGLSHGFLLGYLESIRKVFPAHINVIMMAPKGMGNSVRLLYLQGQETEGAGINSSIAVHQDITPDGRALDYALGWAVGTGSPVTFFTTMKNEVRSDLFGERAMLLGGLWGLSEALYRYFRNNGYDKNQAFLCSAKGLTGTVSGLISQQGLLGFYNNLPAGLKPAFETGYSRAYGPAYQTMLKIYDNVYLWREISEVVTATEAIQHTPMSDIEASEMWAVGKNLYNTVVPMDYSLAFAAGAYVAGIMAQMNLLRERGHCTSEIVNESLIEAIDSLNPFMDKRGVSYMVDNCSTTARLGTRKWGPEFQKAFCEVARRSESPETFSRFLADHLHYDVETCFRLRPSVKIAVS